MLALQLAASPSRTPFDPDALAPRPPARRGLAGVGGWFSLGLAIAAYRRGDKPRLDYEARYGPPPPTV